MLGETVYEEIPVCLLTVERAVHCEPEIAVMVTLQHSAELFGFGIEDHCVSCRGGELLPSGEGIQV